MKPLTFLGLFIFSMAMAQDVDTPLPVRWKPSVEKIIAFERIVVNEPDEFGARTLFIRYRMKETCPRLLAHGASYDASGHVLSDFVLGKGRVAIRQEVFEELFDIDTAPGGYIFFDSISCGED